MIINHNMQALNSHRQMGVNAVNSQKSMEKLSSGLRINRAGDDAAGLTISEKMRAQIRGLDQANRNAQDGISLIQTAEGALNSTHSILQRMRQLAVESGKGTNTEENRAALQNEINQLKEEVDRIGNTTEFNTKKLLNGSLAGAKGVSTSANTTIGGGVAKLEAGKMTAGTAIKADHSAATFGKDTITIDGQKIDVNWDTLLSQEQKDLLKSDLTNASATTIKQIGETLTNAINTAIDNSGKSVGHITGYVEDATNKLVLTSSTNGTKSEVTLSSVAGATSIGATFISNTAGAVSAAANTGTSKYNGTAIVGKSFDVYMNNQLIGQSDPLTVNNGDDMATAATELQTAINEAIDKYNGATGKTSGQDGFLQNVNVTVSDDGRFVISSPSGEVSLKDLKGNTAVTDIGLSQAQTEASGDGGMTYQIGANRDQTITFGIKDMRSAALGISALDITSEAGAQVATTSLDQAISSVSSQRAQLGAIQNRLEYTINNLGTSSENLTAAESRIRDVDMAKEMMEFTKNNVLNQAAQAMLAQANQLPNQILQLLR